MDDPLEVASDDDPIGVVTAIRQRLVSSEFLKHSHHVARTIPKPNWARRGFDVAAIRRDHFRCIDLRSNSRQLKQDRKRTNGPPEVTPFVA
jgi:hypothetical protein